MYNIGSKQTFAINLRRTIMKYVCDVCGYVYDPEENGGVAFEDLPEDWTCPICGVAKDNFSAE